MVFLRGLNRLLQPPFTADIVPAHRRGEAMGVLGVSMNVGASMSPPFGSYIAQTYSLESDVLHFLCSGTGFHSYPLAFKRDFRGSGSL